MEEEQNLGEPGAARAAMNQGQKSLTDLLDEIERRANAATPAPWPLETVKTSCGCCHKIGMFPGPEHKPFNYACVYADGEYADNSHLTARGKVLLANATFIAAARSDVPALVKALRRALTHLESFHSKADSTIRTVSDIAELLREPADSVPSGSKALTPPGKQKPVLIEPAEQKEKL